MRNRSWSFALVIGVVACAPSRASVAVRDEEATATAVVRLAEDVLAAARARDADRFISFFAPGEGLVYAINARKLESRDAVHAAFRGLLARNREFDPRWTDRRVQAMGPGAAVFSGSFRTTARDSTGRAWGVRGVVTFAARRDAAGWRIVNWHTSEVPADP